MRHFYIAPAATSAALLLLAAHAVAQAPVTDPLQMESRITRLERSLSSSSLMQMHQTLQNLEREVRDLRGEIEVQRHEIGQLKQRQRDLYLDLDKRLQPLEGGAAPGLAGAPAPAGAGTAIAPPASAAPPPPVAPAAPVPAPPPPVAGTAAPPPVAAAAVDPAAEQQAYRNAFDLLKGGQFAASSAALGKFLQDYPNGRFADNAQYWLGESHYVSREFDSALNAFEKLLQDYPDSPKHSHAMLKIGFIHDEQGRPEQARQVLTDLIQRFPQSTAAGLAAKRLKRLKQP